MRQLIFFCLLFTLYTACKKEKTEPVIYPDYGNLQVGNYWIYQRFLLENGVYKPQNTIDSNYVEKDTLINGQTFAKLKSIKFEAPTGTYQSLFLRDSLHYIVDEKGKILFSSENTVDTFSTGYFILDFPSMDTVAFTFAKMDEGVFTTDVPAGSFQTKNYRFTYVLYPGWSQGGDTRDVINRYAEDVGLVEETLGAYVGSPIYPVRRLIRYGKN